MSKLSVAPNYNNESRENEIILFTQPHSKEHLSKIAYEIPSSYADRLGSSYASTVTLSAKKNKGQFFTPINIAKFMGGLAVSDKKGIDILDPGCGTAILSCSLIENLVEQNSYLKTINLTVYETDTKLEAVTEKSILYLKNWLANMDISLQYSIYSNDFIIKNNNCLNPSNFNFSEVKQDFDFIISNPPYFKLPKEDYRVKLAQSIIDGQPNIYAIFLAISTQMLKKDGKMIFIVPRSFTSGRYFNAFRNYFLKHIQIDFIHLFESRKDTFSRDSVLQETLILKAKPKNENEINPKIVISSCSGLHDIEHSQQFIYHQNDLIDLNSKEKIIHLPTNTKEDAVMSLFKTWSGSLNKYNIQISTGPIVAFRMESFIKETPEEETVSLYWLHNINKMDFNFPLQYKNKKQFILTCKKTKPYLIPNKNYVFLRRFSSKDDKSRLIATPYFASIVDKSYIGVENKLNYIYRPQGNLTRAEIMGIAALLNSKLFDTYFRTFNGNVNVSATEIRTMPLPPLETIQEIGKEIILQNNFSIDIVNKVINKYFELNRE